MNSKEIKLQQQKAELNDEAFRILDVLVYKNNLIRDNKLLVTLKIKEDQNEETEEWTGIIQSLKVFTKFYFHKSLDVVERIDEKIDTQKEKINVLEKTLNSKIEQLDSKIDLLDQKIDTKIGSLDKKIDNLEASFASMNEDIVTKIFMGLESFKEEINKNKQENN